MKYAKLMSKDEIKNTLQEADKNSILVSLALFERSQRVEKFVLELSENYLIASNVYFHDSKSTPYVYFFDEIQEATLVPKNEDWKNVDNLSLADLHKLAKKWYSEKVELQNIVKSILLTSGLNNENRKVFAARLMLEEIVHTARFTVNPSNFIELVAQLQSFYL